MISGKNFGWYLLIAFLFGVIFILFENKNDNKKSESPKIPYNTETRIYGGKIIGLPTYTSIGNATLFKIPVQWNSNPLRKIDVFVVDQRSALRFRIEFLEGFLAEGDSVYFYTYPTTETMPDGTPHTAYFGILDRIVPKPKIK